MMYSTRGGRCQRAHSAVGMQYAASVAIMANSRCLQGSWCGSVGQMGLFATEYRSFIIQKGRIVADGIHQLLCYFQCNLTTCQSRSFYVALTHAMDDHYGPKAYAAKFRFLQLYIFFMRQRSSGAVWRIVCFSGMAEYWAARRIDTVGKEFFYGLFGRIW